MPKAQLGLWDGGERERDAGVAKVETNERSFVERMRSHAATVARVNGNVSSDDLRRYAKAVGIKPNHPNAWGSIFRGGMFEQIGYRRSMLRSNHGRQIRVWALK